MEQEIQKIQDYLKRYEENKQIPYQFKYEKEKDNMKWAEKVKKKRVVLKKNDKRHSV